MDVLERLDKALHWIPSPVTTEEAKLLLQAFGSDGCFGLAWSLIHLIESAPVSPLDTKPGDLENEWVRYLWERMQRAKRPR
ncbi:MAG: hypothetical protein ABI678_26980 [Kofleriaceae bacterium]